MKVQDECTYSSDTDDATTFCVSSSYALGATEWVGAIIFVGGCIEGGGIRRGKNCSNNLDMLFFTSRGKTPNVTDNEKKLKCS